jgi:hypothetical protein
LIYQDEVFVTLYSDCTAGARLGKSGGALVQQGLVLLFGSILRGAPVIAVLFYASIFAWIGMLGRSRSGMTARVPNFR